MAQNNVKKQPTFTTRSGETFPLLAVNEVDFTPYIRKMLENAPEPPLELVEGRLVPNPARQDYQDAVQDHTMKKGMLMMALYMEYGLDIELDEEQQAQVDRIKRRMEKRNRGALENGFDLFIYAKSVTDAEELTLLMQAIQNINNPTAEGVQAALDTFRPGVPGPANNGNKDASVWDRVSVGKPETDPLQSGEVGGDRLGSLLRRANPTVAG